MPQGTVILLLYVDDLLLTGTNMTMINNSKALLHKELRMTDLGHIRKFLGSGFHTHITRNAPAPESISQGDHSLLYFAYTCVRDPFIGGLLTLQNNYKVMVFYM
jgi:hypothetical protein